MNAYANATDKWREEVGAEAARLINQQGINPNEAWKMAEKTIKMRRCTSNLSKDQLEQMVRATEKSPEKVLLYG
jgi:hypothetical protein